MKSICEILSELPEWSDDWKSHALFCAYDEDTSEEFVVQFWKRALQKIFDEYTEGCSLNCEELRSSIQRKGRSPLGLQDIINELVKRGDLMSVEELKENVNNKLASQAWGSWINNKIMTIWKNSITTSHIISVLKIKKFSEKLIKWCRDRDRPTFLKEEIVKNFSILEKDLDVLIDFMFLQGNAIRFQEKRENVTVEFVKFKTSPDGELSIKPEDSAIVTLTSTISEIDAKIQELTETRGFLHEKVLSELRLQNKINAKHFLMRRKMVEKKIEALLGSRVNIEEQLLSLISSVANKNIINALKITNNVLKNLTPDMKIVTEIIDTSKDNLENHRDISNMLVENFDDSNNEDLLQEFESLGEYQLPSVPTYKIEAKNQEKPVFQEKTENVLNS